MNNDNNEIIQNQLKILQELSSLKKDFNSKIKYDEQKEKTIDKLHNELQIYRNDLYKKLLLPMINDLIHFITRNEKETEYLENFSKEELLQRIKDINDDLKDILYRQGVESYNLENDEFDPKKQKIINTLETDKKELDKKIANHRTPGYEWEGKIIKHENVDIYLYSPPENTQSTENIQKEEEINKNENKENFQEEESNE